MKEKEYELTMGNYPLIRSCLAELGVPDYKGFRKT